MSPTSYRCSIPRRTSEVYRFQAVPVSGVQRCLVKYGPGIDLFSQRVTPPVSSTLKRFTSVFGMGTGGTTSLETPGPPIERKGGPRRSHQSRECDRCTDRATDWDRSCWRGKAPRVMFEPSAI